MHADAPVAQARLKRVVDTQAVLPVGRGETLNDPPTYHVHRHLLEPPAGLFRQHQHHLRPIVLGEPRRQGLREAA